MTADPGRRSRRDGGGENDQRRRDEPHVARPGRFRLLARRWSDFPISLTVATREEPPAGCAAGPLHALRQHGGGHADAAGSVAADRLEPRGVRRLGLAPAGRELLDGFEALAAGDEDAALAILEQAPAPARAEAAWAVGLLRLRRREIDAARAHLASALAHGERLGVVFGECGVAATATLRITGELDVHLRPCERGVRLALAAIAQAQGRVLDALDELDRLADVGREEPLVGLWIAELAREAGRDRRHAVQVVGLTTDVANDSVFQAAVLLHRGRAFVLLGRPGRALAAFSAALRRRKGRPAALLRQVRYERAVLHETLGWRTRAWRALESLHAEDPALEDVAARLATRA